jgi:dTDP-D-glucose 4,6-dehydratase
MPIYGDSVESIGSRVYLHAKNLASAIIFLLNYREPMRYSDYAWNEATGTARPDRWNVCGESEITNLGLAELVAKIMGRPLKWHLKRSESARPGYDRRYSMDGTKLRTAGWIQPFLFQESIQQIVDWSIRNSHWSISDE